MPDPIPVISQGFGWTAAGAWGAFLALLGIIVRQVGPWKKIDSEGRAADFVRLREDVKEARRESREAKETAGRLENMVACMRPAISILISEVRRLDPDSANNAALLQVTELMAMAATGDLGALGVFARLSTVRSKGE